MVPVSYWVILAMGVSPDIAIRIAFGTSLLVILPTALSGTWRHNKKKAIRWKTALILGSFGLLGALLGANLAARLPNNILEIGFGGLVLAIALWMGLGLILRLRREAEEPRENLGLVAACGFPIGVAVGLHNIDQPRWHCWLYRKWTGSIWPAPLFHRLYKFAYMAMLGSYQHTLSPAWSPSSTCPACQTVKLYLYYLYGLLGLKDDWRILIGREIGATKST